MKVIELVTNVGTRVECGSFCHPKLACSAFALDEETKDCYIMDAEWRYGTVVSAPAQAPMKTYFDIGLIKSNVTVETLTNTSANSREKICSIHLCSLGT